MWFLINAELMNAMEHALSFFQENNLVTKLSKVLASEAGFYKFNNLQADKRNFIFSWNSETHAVFKE